MKTTIPKLRRIIRKVITESEYPEQGQAGRDPLVDLGDPEAIQTLADALDMEHGEGFEYEEGLQTAIRMGYTENEFIEACDLLNSQMGGW